MVNLEKYIPPSTLSEVYDVLEFGDIKHPGDDWMSRTREHHLQHAMEHIDLSVIEGVEKESGCSHLAHAIVRVMFALAIDQDYSKQLAGE